MNPGETREGVRPNPNAACEHGRQRRKCEVCALTEQREGVRVALEEIDAELRKAKARAHRVDPNPGTGEDEMFGPGAYDRGTAYGLGVALHILRPLTEGDT